MINLGVFGATGRMGQEVISEAKEGFAGKINKVFSFKKGENVTDFLKTSNLVIDFSIPEGTYQLVKALKTYNKKANVLIATTGNTREVLEDIEALGEKHSIMIAPNVSLGANLLSLISGKLASFLDPTYDIEIIDTHHKHKKDAPSGTAIMIAQEMQKSRLENFSTKAEIIKSRAVSPLRQEGEIGISSLRCGEVIGEHEVCFAGKYEQIKLSHNAGNRKLFANGALKAGIWLMRQPNGIYRIKDMLKEQIKF